MGNMDGQACPNVAVQPGSEWVCGCGCSVEYCQRLMGGVWWAHNGAPTMEGWLPCQFTKSPHMHTGLAATLPWLVHHYVPTIHLPSTSGNTPHCTHTPTPTPSPAALPHLDMPVQPCFPLPGGIFTTNQP